MYMNSNNNNHHHHHQQLRDDQLTIPNSSPKLSISDPSISSSNFSSSSSFEESSQQSSFSYVFWKQQISNRLCPNMRPNLTYTKLLFDLAWDELQKEDMFQQQVHHHHPRRESDRDRAAVASAAAAAAASNLTTTTNPYAKGRQRYRGDNDISNPSVTEEYFYDHEFWGFVVYQPPPSHHPHLENKTNDTTHAHPLAVDTNPDRLVYTTIWKSANNYIKTYFKHVLHGRYGGNDVGRGKQRQLIEDWDAKYIFWSPDRPRSKYTNPNDTFCIVTAIRDPVGHFLSGYNEIEHRSLHWYDHWASPPSSSSSSGGGKYNQHHNNTYERYPYASKERFIQFLADILNGATQMSKKRYDIYHVYSQMKVLSVLSKYNRRLDGYLDSLTNIETTWPKFVVDTCPNAVPSVYKNHDYLADKPLVDAGKHDSSNDTYGFYKGSQKSLV